MVKVFYIKVIIMASTNGTVKVGKYEIENFNGKNNWRMQIKNNFRKVAQGISRKRTKTRGHEG